MKTALYSKKGEKIMVGKNKTGQIVLNIIFILL